MSTPPPMSGDGTGHVSVNRGQRQYARKSVIEEQLITADLGPQKRGIVIDLSEGGMAIQPFTRLEAGEATTLEFDIPGRTDRVHATGIVAWVGDSGRSGIQFLNVSEESRSYLKEWLARARDAKPTSKPNKEANLLGSATASDSLPGLEAEDEELDRDAALALLVERARALARADGAAIALADRTGMMCRASVGSAPDVGVPLRPDAGLTGECVRTARVVTCDDAEADPRIDAAVARSLNLRSVVVVPLLSKGMVFGIFEVLSSKPNAFDGRDVLNLQRLGELISVLADYPQGSEGLPERMVGAETTAGDLFGETEKTRDVASAEILDIFADDPVIEDMGQEPLLLEDLEQLVAEHSAEWNTASVSAGVAPTCKFDEEVVFPSGDPALEIPVVANEATTVATSIPVAPVQTQTVSVPWAATEMAVPFSNWEDEEQVRERFYLRPVWRTLFLILLCGLILAGAWYAFRYAKQITPPQIAPQTPAAPTSMLTPVPEPASPSIVAAGANTAPDKSLQKPKAAIKSLVSQGKNASPISDIAIDTISVTPVAAAPEPVPPAPDVASPIRERAEMANLAVPAVVAPPPPAKQIRVSDVQPGKLIYSVQPKYPTAGFTLPDEVVVLKFTINRKGTVENVKVLRGNLILARAAMDAVSKWRYEPFKLNGQAVDVDQMVNINFRKPR